MPAELKQRIEQNVRAHYKLPRKVQVTVGDRKAGEYGNYDLVPITLSSGPRTTTYDFLISKDGNQLIQLTKLDITHAPFDPADRPGRGASAKDAKVTVIVYDDFQCPYCAMMHKTLFREVLPEYKDSVRVVYKDYPLADIHPWAIHAAVNANCLAEQNLEAYWDFADYVHFNQGVIRGDKRPLPEQMALLDSATAERGAKYSLDAKRLEACTKAQAETAVRASMKEGDDLGVEATPTLFINGEKMDGAIPADELRKTLDAALREAGVKPPEHAPAAGSNAKPASSAK